MSSNIDKCWRNLLEWMLSMVTPLYSTASQGSRCERMGEGKQEGSTWTGNKVKYTDNQFTMTSVVNVIVPSPALPLSSSIQKIQDIWKKNYLRMNNTVFLSITLKRHSAIFRSKLLSSICNTCPLFYHILKERMWPDQVKWIQLVYAITCLGIHGYKTVATSWTYVCLGPWTKWCSLQLCPQIVQERALCIKTTENIHLMSNLME